MQMIWQQGELCAILIDTNWYKRELHPYRMLFFRQLEIGFQERIEISTGNPIAGDISKNATPYHFDDWELTQLFKLNLQNEVAI